MKTIAQLIVFCMIPFFLLSGCGDQGPLFPDGSGRIAYWEIYQSNKSPTGDGYAFGKDGKVSYFFRQFHPPMPGRFLMDTEDVFNLDSTWSWHGDTLLVEGFQRLMVPIHPETLLIVNPKTLDSSLWVYSADQTTPVTR